MKIIWVVFILSSGIWAEKIPTKETLEKSVFKKQDGKIYANSTVLTGANPEKFKVFQTECAEGYCFGMDDKRVYYYSNPLPNSDPETFEFFHQGYMGDAKNMYYIMDNIFKQIKGADPKSFQVLGSVNMYAYAKDKKFAYYDGEKIPGSHGPSFQLVEGNPKYEAKDKNQFYIGLEGFKPKKKK